MNTDRLLAHYEHVVNAPDTIPRLRRFILDLAVQGKLVPQDPNDESAPELLKRMATEKTRMLTAGEIRKPREGHDGAAAQTPFIIPGSWRWVGLGAIGAIVGGGTPPATDIENFAEPGTGVPWLTPADLGGRTPLFIARGARDLSEKGLRASAATVMPSGSILFTSRAPIGYVSIAANPISTNQGFKSIVPYVPDCSRFIALAMQAFAPAIDAKAPGTTFKEVSARIVAALPFPLPPLKEQHRIVAKVDELMALCDRLAAASLARLNAPDPDPAVFASHSRFALDNFSALATRPDQVKQIRQTILNLAVRGLLVRQDTSDKPVSIQLFSSDRLRQEVAAEDRRADSESQILLADDGKWAVPDSWQWRALADLVLFIDYRGKTPKKTDQGKRLITAKNVKAGCINLQPEEFLSDEDYRAWMTRGLPKIDDVLFTTEAPLGNAAVVNMTEPFALAQRVICFRHYGSLDSAFLVMQLLAEPFQIMLNKTATGLTARGIKAAKLRRLPMAVPPLAEQRRIVAKVDELMELCDRLEASLAAVEDHRRRLLGALLAEALAPVEMQAGG